MLSSINRFGDSSVIISRHLTSPQSNSPCNLRIDYCDARPFGGAILELGYLFD